MAEIEVKRKKPKFFRKDWSKKIKLGLAVKKNRKWRRPIGIHNKIRLKKRGHAKKPTIGWQADKKTRGQINGMDVERVENIRQLEAVRKGTGIFIGKVGKKKRKELIKKAKEKGLKILNRYREEKKNATK